MRSILALVPFALLAACGGGGDAPPAEQAPAEVAAPVQAASAGETTYQQVCVSCHQPDGKGISPSFPPLAGSALLNGDAAKPIAIVLHGFQGEIVREGTTYNGIMSPWAMLSDEEIAAVLTYARSSFGNSAAAVTAAEVAAVRAKTADRAAAWTEAELEAATLR